MQNFNYHSHTYRCGHSDADMSDEDYIKDYIKMGFKKIAITDHCPEKNVIDTRDKKRMEYTQKDEYLQSIQYLKEKYKDCIDIKVGYEVEYIPGEEANIQELKDETDIIVLGQHFIYGNENSELRILGKCDYTDEELHTYVNYIEKALELEIPDIIAHPDLYLSHREQFGEIEEKVAHELCSVAEKYKIPLEINLNNIFQKTYNQNRILNNLPLEEQRKKLINVQYPRKEFWDIACNYDIKVLYGLDTHYRGQIPVWNELVQLANEMIGEDTINKLNFIDSL
ncbi:MAG: PHP domain-containing protein [Clostridia bacterium]|nr:PHP domain-containing protein [Clostridia bacterium]